MYKCPNCGEVFPEPEMEIERSLFYDGFQPFVQTIYSCPRCGYEGFDEAGQCKNCGEYSVDLCAGMCDNCYRQKLDELQADVGKCFEIGKRRKIKVELNSFIAMSFDEEEIEKILLKEALKQEKEYMFDCSQFVDTCTDEIDEYLEGKND